MLTLSGARLLERSEHKIEVGLDRGLRLTLFFLGAHLARLLITRPEGLRMKRTWSISPELDAACSDPIDGRCRLDLTGFQGTPIRSITETGTSITVETAFTRIEIRRVPLALEWQFRENLDEPFATVLEDRPTQAYQFERTGPRFAHFLKRDPGEHYYGFGEKSGNANKHGRRLRMRTTDALGYDAESSDPLYKHIPFYLTVRPDRSGEAIGLFYDNLAQGAFDLGQEIDAYHGPYRSFEAEDGDLDLYVIFGPSVRETVASFTALTGRTAMPPRWSLSYSGSTMQYTDAPNPVERLTSFLDLLAAHDIPCRSFHMSSGYTLKGGKRYVFNWDRGRFPEPQALGARFGEAGIRLIANIKPAMLLDHPQFGEIERFHGFVRDSEDSSRLHIAQFWGGDAAYLDFTNPRTSQWWSAQVKTQLLDQGISATWNDNNEFEIWDDAAGAHLNGTGGTMACLRPVQTALMLRASALAQAVHAPSKRPYLVSRSGGPGMQRYAQTWTGDNRTDWKTLKYNLRMGHGLSLSGLFNFGHDVGGFAGPKPDPELFMRWIEQAVYWPRFTIHSWNDDASTTEPWMYPDLLPLVRTALHWRERLVPLFYTLMWRAHACHEPVLRPPFFDFPEQAQSYGEDNSFMVGPDLLVAPVVEAGAESRSVWLPETPDGWYSLRTGDLLSGGARTHVNAPLGAAPAFLRAGSILPLGPAPSWTDGALSLRLFPSPARNAKLAIYDDDGESIMDHRKPPCLLHVTAAWTEGKAQLDIWREGPRHPRWPELQFEDEAGRPIPVSVNDQPPALSVTSGILPVRQR
jgi:alpha-glucosidase